MVFDINLTKDKPAYLQIKDYIKDMILKGMLFKDEKLPSTRELSLRLKVSRNTIIAAYEYLEDEGFIYTEKGKGAYVAGVKVHSQQGITLDWNKRINDYAKKANTLDIVKNEIAWQKGMISFKSISPDNSLFEMEEFKKAFLNRITLEGEKLLNYGYAKGYKPLCEYLLKYIKNKGVNIEGKDILVTNGFTEGFDIVISSLTEKGDRVICEEPTHNTAIKIMKLHGLELLGVDLEDDGIDLVKLKAVLSEKEAKLAYIIPSYHNPTAIVMSSKKREEAYKLFSEFKVPIVEDGFNEELRYSGAHIAPMAALSGEGNNVIYIGSFSKILFPGIRIGWIMADKELISHLESVKRSRNIHTSFLDQALLYEYLLGGNFEKYLKKARKAYKEKYEYAIKCAEKFIPCKKILGEGGLHIFIELYEGLDSREVLKRCYNRGVIFTPGDIFYTEAQVKNTLRLGFSRVSTEEIEEGFKVIGEVIKEMEE